MIPKTQPNLLHVHCGVILGLRVWYNEDEGKISKVEILNDEDEPSYVKMKREMQYVMLTVDHLVRGRFNIPLLTDIQVNDTGGESQCSFYS